MTTRFPKARKPHFQASETHCVHCGARENQLSFHAKAMPDGTPIEPLYHVTCMSCQATGAMATSAEEAIRLWGTVAPRLVEDEPPALLDEMNFEDEEAAL